jgi:hypothetical protein
VTSAGERSPKDTATPQRNEPPYVAGPGPQYACSRSITLCKSFRRLNIVHIGSFDGWDIGDVSGNFGNIGGDIGDIDVVNVGELRNNITDIGGDIGNAGRIGDTESGSPSWPRRRRIAATSVSESTPDSSEMSILCGGERHRVPSKLTLHPSSDMSSTEALSNT